MSDPNEIIPTPQNWLDERGAWIAKRDELIALAEKVTAVENQDDLNASAKIQNALSKSRKELKDARMEITRQLDAFKKTFMNQEAELAEPLEAQLARLKKQNNTYNTAQELIRQAELRRLADEQRKADEAAAAAQIEAEELFGGEVVVDEPAATPVAPAPEKVRSDAARIVKRWNHELVDISKVSPEFLTVTLNAQAVRAYLSMCTATGKEPSIPGIRFSFTMSTESK